MWIKAYFKDWCNFWSFAIGLVPALILYIIPAETTISMKIFIIVLFMFLLALWWGVQLTFVIKENDVRKSITIIECSHNKCICKANNLLSVHSVVSFYLQQGNHEELIGYGYVETVNTKNAAQIVGRSCSKDIEDIISYINDNKESIIVRPTITLDAVDGVYSSLRKEEVYG